MIRVHYYINVFVLLLCCAGCTAKGSPAVAPGTVEDAPPAGLEKALQLHEKLGITNDEFAIYYVRQDEKYDDWALWIWALPGGDGSKAWEYTQSWNTENGIAFMRFKKSGLENGTPLLGANGDTGFIVRKRESWEKDGEADRQWNFKTDNACIVFSQDEHTYMAKAYKPRMTRAVMETPRTIRLTLSGKYGLDTDGGFSGFSVKGSRGSYLLKTVANADNPQTPYDNFTASIIIESAEPLALSDSITVYNEHFEGAITVDMKDLLLQTLEKTIPEKNALLGAHYNAEEKSCRFALWSPVSENVSVNLYKNADDNSPASTLPMQYDEKTGVWSLLVSGYDTLGLFYDYTLTNSAGTQQVLDPYAYSMAAYTDRGGIGRAAVVDLQSPALLPEQVYPYPRLQKREDAVIYEVSVRDFTISPDSDVQNIPGTYKAFIEKIPYLKKLGITHVQLMPVLNFYYTDETNRNYEDAGTVQNNNYNWGYDPHNYFTPEGWYASDPHNPNARIKELRELINECHKEGIAVILDVVYNHMAKTDFLDSIVPGYYFRTGKSGQFTSASGCGNDIASERAMARKLIVDSTVHWVREYKADGFRFDLMGLLDTETVLDAYNECAKVHPEVLFVGEGWKMYNGAAGTVGMDQRFMTETDSVAVFNDEFRDLLKAGGMNEGGRGFLTKKGPDLERLFANCLGMPQINYRADSPGDNVQYLVCHDGLTLHDTIAHNARLDESKPEEKRELIARIKLGNVFALTSQGIAFLHAGQERGRTKPNFHNVSQECVGKFVRNSYDASDSVNRFIWSIDKDYQHLLDYTAGLIRLRKKYEVFRIGNIEKITKAATHIATDDKNRLAFGYSLDWTDGTWFILYNSSNEKQEFYLKGTINKPRVFADAAGVYLDGKDVSGSFELSEHRVLINPCTAVIFRSDAASE
ncbi:MAG: alpha-amylase family glycosyl hydrolase [Treponema sp.]